MRKLKDIGDTKYYYVSNLDIINKIKEDIDIDDCHFVSVAFMELVVLQRNGYRVIDSTNEKRNNILKFNQEVIQKEPQSWTPLPLISRFEKIKDYLEKLEKNITYSLEYNQDNQRTVFALASMVSLTRPSIQIMPWLSTVDFFKFVKRNIGFKNILKLLEEETEWNYLIGEAIIPATLKKEEVEIELYGLGVFTRKEIANSVNILPAKFGTERMIGDELYKRLYTNCFEIINRYQREQNNTLRNKIIAYEGLRLK